MGNKQSVLSRFLFKKNKKRNQKSEKTGEKVLEKTKPRVLFLSFQCFFNEWKQIPTDILYESILIFAANRNDIYDHHIHDEQFLTILRYKEKQGYLLWLGASDPQSVVDGQQHAHWDRVSRFLSLVHDPTTHDFYAPIESDIQWWYQKYEHQVNYIVNRDAMDDMSWYDALFTIEYCDNVRAVVKELQECRWKWNAVKEIIHQSNPTLIPMTKWNPAQLHSKSQKILTCLDCNKSLSEISDSLSPDSLESDHRISFGMEDTDGTVYLT